MGEKNWIWAKFSVKICFKNLHLEKPEPSEIQLLGLILIWFGFVLHSKSNKQETQARRAERSKCSGHLSSTSQKQIFTNLYMYKLLTHLSVKNTQLAADQCLATYIKMSRSHLVFFSSILSVCSSVCRRHLCIVCSDLSLT